MWNDLRDEVFRKLGKEYNDQFDNPQDLEDLGLIDLIEDLGLTVADMRRQEIEKLDEALRKLDEGTYGVCSSCGEEIDEGRLNAVPFAEYCLRCKGESEGREGSKKPTL